MYTHRRFPPCLLSAFIVTVYLSWCAPLLSRVSADADHLLFAYLHHPVMPCMCIPVIIMLVRLVRVVDL